MLSLQPSIKLGRPFRLTNKRTSAVAASLFRATKARFGFETLLYGEKEAFRSIQHQYLMSREILVNNATGHLFYKGRLLGEVGLNLTGASIGTDGRRVVLQSAMSSRKSPRARDLPQRKSLRLRFRIPPPS